MQDPQFHLDVSFYAWDYPAYRLLLGFGFTAIIFAIILSTVVHYLSGAIRLQTPGPKVTPAARRHLTVLVFVFVVLKAIAYWLDRYGLVFSDRSTFTGASYTDVHAVLPARTILFWIAIVIAAGLIASLWLRSTLLPGIAFVSMLVLEHSDQRHLPGDPAAGVGQAERQQQGSALHQAQHQRDPRRVQHRDQGQQESERHG